MVPEARDYDCCYTASSVIRDLKVIYFIFEYFAHGQTMLSLSQLKKIPAKYPLAFGIVFSGMKTSLSDLLVQKIVERREHVDWKRNGAFATFGFVYLGGVQYSIYVTLFSKMFPNAAKFAMKPFLSKLTDVKGMMTLFAQVAIDQCLHHPFLYFPAFYCTKELVMNPQRPNFVRCMQEYRNNMMEDLSALWKIWVPATLINFAFMPMHLRIPFTAGVSLLWTCILSTMRGGDIEHAVDMVGGAVTGATLHMIEEDLYHSTSGNFLFTEPIDLASDKHHIVITASGRDRPGWVALLSRAVTDGGGSVTESRMVRLGDEFIIVMHVAVPFEQHKSMQSKIRNTKSLKPLNIKCTSIARRKTGTFQAPMSGVRIRCIGSDR